jgi:hypothetical protein
MKITRLVQFWTAFAKIKFYHLCRLWSIMLTVIKYWEPSKNYIIFVAELPVDVPCTASCRLYPLRGTLLPRYAEEFLIFFIKYLPYWYCKKPHKQWP